MNLFDGLAAGFAVALSPSNVLAAFIGVTLGTIVGVLPGIGPIGTMALLLPFTYALDARAALIMLAGIFYGAMYGGSTTAILVNLPGEAASVVTTLDGYKMARKGRAGAALAVAAIGSFVAGTVGLLGLTLFAPVLANSALAFGPPEYFAVCILGLALLTRLTEGSVLVAMGMVLVGMMVGTVGLDLMSGVNRFSGDLVQLSTGIELVPLVMGIFGIAEILVAVTAPGGAPEVQRVPLRTLYPSREEMRRSTMPIARGTLLGFLIGLLPGPATILASFTSYAIERRLARRPEEFGRGAVEGVAGPEAANNSATSGAMVPLLALGLPFAPATAMLLGGFMIHGITPGPLLMVQHPDVFWGLVVSMYIGNAMLLILNLPLVGVFASLIRTPARILMPLIMALVVLGAYAVNNRMFDVWIMLIAGAFGYALRLARISPAPLVVGFVLGPFAELYARQSLAILYGQPAAILARPISGALLALTAVIVAAPPVLRLLRGRLVAGR